MDLCLPSVPSACSYCWLCSAGFEFREILLIFLAAAAVALAIWYLKQM